MKPLGIKNYGSIPHLLESKLGKTDKYIHEGQHNILTKKTRDKNDFITVTEKYDGSNVGIAKNKGRLIALTRSGNLAEKSKYKHHCYFAKWVYKNYNRFDSIIDEGERLVGEWLMQVHSIKYHINEAPFVAFDYFDSDNKRILHSDLIIKATIAELQTPRIIFFGYNAFSIDVCLERLNGNKHEHSIIAEGSPEGVVYRLERKGVYELAAKFVRPNYESGKCIIGIDEKDLIWNVEPNYL